jgi:hypothetical protein
MIVRPRPPLNFDETMDVLRQVHVGGYVTVGVFERDRGFPSASFSGWLTRLDVSDVGGLLVVRDDPDDATPVSEPGANTLWISRSEFREAGEALDAEDMGPLRIDVGGLSAIVSGRDVVPDWAALRR